MSGRFEDGARAHVEATLRAVACLVDDAERIERWGRGLARVLSGGGRVLAAGNGGSAAHAQHLTSELVGRYREDRAPLSAIALHADTSALTAIANDFGAEEMFARQVRAHGRAGDVLVAFSTSGQSLNLVAAARDAVAREITVWAVTGRGPNELTRLAHDSLVVDDASTAVVQEVHQVTVHLLCEAIEAALPGSTAVPVASHA